MKKANQLSEIFISADRDGLFDNRSFDVKALNKALDAGLIITLSTRGRIFRTSKGVKWNLKLKIGEKVIVWYIENYITPYCILTRLAKMIQNTKLQLSINTEYKLSQHCSKCDGKGIIPAFSFYCNGICFDCLGLGYKNKYTTINI